MEVQKNPSEITLACPVCKKEVDIGEDVFFHPADMIFYHTACLETLKGKTIGELNAKADDTKDCESEDTPTDNK